MPAFVVPPGSGPIRLDVFLVRHMANGSRRRARQAIEAGAVRVNDRRGSKSVPVTTGDRIEVDAAWLTLPVLPPNPNLPVRILYEDGALLAVDKPAGMPSHALRGDETATVANFLLAHDPGIATAGTRPLEAGLVHRLDTGTSGVLLAARTRAAYVDLRRQFSACRVVKEYRAVVHGRVGGAGEIVTPLVPARGHTRMRVCRAGDPRGQSAVTRYAPLKQCGTRTLLAVTIATGVRHQIRAHLASIGHPVVGDRVYGTVAGDEPRWQLLHAFRLGCTHPETGGHIDISAPLPAAFAAFA